MTANCANGAHRAPAKWQESYMIFIIVIAVVVVLLLVGAAMSSGNVVPSSNPREGCKVCDGYDAWWKSLSWWQKGAAATWYSINKLACLIKGC